MVTIKIHKIQTWMLYSLFLCRHAVNWEHGNVTGPTNRSTARQKIPQNIVPWTEQRQQKGRQEMSSSPIHSALGQVSTKQVFTHSTSCQVISFNVLNAVWLTQVPNATCILCFNVFTNFNNLPATYVTNWRMPQETRIWVLMENDPSKAVDGLYPKYSSD